TYANMHLFSMSRAERRRVIDIMIKYYRLHLPSFPELKSLAVLHQIFD
ncbi:MAG: DNA repair protein RecO, partial [Bacteroidales bacterium]|nr:DNA repair protein RecO [Bacteroidales bacterium]